MEVKKSPKADLENKKILFFEVGMMLALGAMLFAFEWKTSVSEVNTFDIVAEVEVEEEIIPITQQLMKPPPPPPPAPRLTDLIEIVEDETVIDEELELSDVDDTSDNKEATTTVQDFGEYGDEETGEAEIFQVVENMPVFSEGNVQAWIAKNVKYPVIARENGIQGKVYVQFVIEKNGGISDVRIVRGVDTSLDKEAARVVGIMPKWTPGKQRGKPVRVSYTLPINFQLTSY